MSDRSKLAALIGLVGVLVVAWFWQASQDVGGGTGKGRKRKAAATYGLEDRVVPAIHYLHVASSTAAVRSQGFSPLDRLNVKNGRRFRHSFKRDTRLAGRVYPHSGVNRSSKGRARGVT